VRIGLLGDLEVRGSDERDIEISGAKLRSFLAILSLHVGRPVQTEQLVDALWGEAPPPGVRNGLQRLASKLRRSLGSTDVVAMRAGGYALDLPPDAVDVHRFDALVEAARRAEAIDAIQLLHEAEALWRGDALVEFAYEDFAAPTITRLTELRRSAIGQRLDLELELGRHHDALPELESLVHLHPLRERLRATLMLALYRAGRQSDALRAYQDGRRILGDELGLEPGPDLRRLEAAILAQDAELGAPVAEAAPEQPPPAHAIPEPLTPLVGREAEVKEVVDLLTTSRLVTLVGPGGVGKTRLALDAGRRVASGRAAGGCLVELAPVGDPGAVRAAIADALALPDPARLAELIGERDVLLVLDNCEHVIAVAASIAEDLLRRCPNLTVLATSREGLRIDGEAVWPVPPLPVPDAVELFLARARAAGARFDATGDALAQVTEICARLDGLPLAIELAAARTRAFPIDQIAGRLHDRFRLLTGGSRTALPRQQTLRAVVDWSYDLLFEDEQRLFERLSVFPGGCDVATATAVCADDALPADDIEDLIQALVEKSLVIASAGAGGVRVTQLQTLAQYGREKLAERGDAESIRRAMATHFAALAARSAIAYTTTEQGPWLRAIDAEQDNLRAALEWAVDRDDAETAMTIAGGTSWRHWLAGNAVEGLRWIDAAFACAGDVTGWTAALGLLGRGVLRLQTGRHDGVDEDLGDALARFRSLGDTDATIMATSFWAELPAVRGDLDEAKRRRRESIASYEALPDDPFVLAGRSFSKAKLAALEGDLALAEACYRDAAARFAPIERPVMLAMTLSLVADFDDRAGDHGAAGRALGRAVGLGDEHGLRGFTGTQLARLGWALLNDGDLDQARAVYDRTVDTARRLRNEPVLFLALTGIAALDRLAGHDDAAAASAREALALHVDAGPRRLANRVDPAREVLGSAAACCTVLAGVAIDDGDVERGALLLAHAERLRDDAGLDVPSFQRGDVDSAEARLRDALDDQRRALAREAGRSGRLGQTIPLDG
jgi:predicted ATPase/DNA-binding SARP family transcriptional activator